MGILDYFKPVSSMSAEEVRAYVRKKRHDEYNLIDVRQPKEYEEGHLPGARLIPVGTLHEGLHGLDPNKPTITYCTVGARSRAAASLLTEHGFIEVYSMSGGIRAWQGRAAEGPPELGMAHFGSAVDPETLIALAWVLEEGSRRFYSALSGYFEDHDAKDLFHDLASAEEHHKSSLLNVYQQITGTRTREKFPKPFIASDSLDDVMEGGMKIREAVQWAENRTVSEILELAMALETNSYDLYVRMSRKMTDPGAQEVFGLLVDDEKRHLDRLAGLLEMKI